MGKIADAAQDFLDNGGTSLGYSAGSLPKLEDLEVVLYNNVHIWEYNGMTEREYYGG